VYSFCQFATVVPATPIFRTCRGAKAEAALVQYSIEELPARTTLPLFLEAAYFFTSSDGRYSLELLYTLTVHRYVFPLYRAVIMLVPLVIPVTFPVFDTRATDFLEEDQVTVDFALESLSCTDLPRVIEALVLFNAIFVEDAAAVCSEKKAHKAKHQTQQSCHSDNPCMFFFVCHSPYLVPLFISDFYSFGSLPKRTRI
jgi:hypothetical protein